MAIYEVKWLRSFATGHKGDKKRICEPNMQMTVARQVCWEKMNVQCCALVPWACRNKLPLALNILRLTCYLLSSTTATRTTTTLRRRRRRRGRRRRGGGRRVVHILFYGWPYLHERLHIEESALILSISFFGRSHHWELFSDQPLPPIFRSV